MLQLLSEGWFVGPWYLVGVVGAAWVAFDVAKTNTALKPAMKWAWPLIVLFLAPLGLLLYVVTARAPGVGGLRTHEEKRRAHDAYEQNQLRRVVGAVIHCVAGDGLGVISAMVLARVLRLTFWQEFWFEYAVGFAFGLFIFQLKAMRMMADTLPRALWLAFRAEFFSMLTVMGGMGAVMAWVTPAAVGMQPTPDTWAFWGFAMLGLVVGFVATLPMNALLIRLGWKHGMGSADGARTVHTPVMRFVVLASMTVLGLGAMAVPAWCAELTRVRARPLAVQAEGAGEVLTRGLLLRTAQTEQLLTHGARTDATAALDALMRVSDVVAANGDARPMQVVMRARKALQRGQADAAVAALQGMPRTLALAAKPARAPSRWNGVPVLGPTGAVLGEVRRAEGDHLDLALGGVDDVYGVFDGRPAKHRNVSSALMIWGPHRVVGRSFAVLMDPVGLISAAPAP